MAYIFSKGAKQFIDGAVTDHEMVQIDTNKFVVAYRDEDDVDKRGMVRVLSISGDTISQGAAVEFDGLQITNIRITKITTTSFAIVYLRNGNTAYIIVGSVSGTTISLGSKVSNARGGAD